MKNTIHIHTEKVKFPTAPEFYGLFFEDINHAADGGLYLQRCLKGNGT